MNACFYGCTYGADRKLARYHSSIHDLFRTGDDFSNLPDPFVIFITEKEVIGRDKPLYRIESRIKETNEPVVDGKHIVYVNGANKDAFTEHAKLMHDFICTVPDDIIIKNWR